MQKNIKTLSISSSSKKLVGIAHSFTLLGTFLKKSFTELRSNDPLRIASATAFFATFAVTPILIIIIQLVGFFIKPELISQQLIHRLNAMLGYKSALQIQETLNNINSLAQNWYITIFGFIFLLFVATTLFQVIEDSLNQIWKIRIKKDVGFFFKMKSRMRSLVIIGLAGILFSVGLVAEGLQTFIGNYIDYLFPDTALMLNNIVNELVFILIVTVWFSNLFRFLTEGRPSWHIAFAGGFLTTLLFTIGKMVVNWGLSKSNIGTIYGASGSIVLIQLFVFYSSLMFYFGGSFIKVLSDYYNSPIKPVKGAYKYDIFEV